MFDTGPGFVFNLGGGPGVRVHQFGGGRPRRRPGTAQPPGSEPAPSVSSALSSLLPLLLLFVLPLLSSLFSGGSSTGPSIIFDGPRVPYMQKHVSHKLKVPYFVQPADVADYSNKNWRNLDAQAEQNYVHKLSTHCQYENQQQQQLRQQATGFFYDDEVMMKRARDMEKPSCKKLQELGISYY